MVNNVKQLNTDIGQIKPREITEEMRDSYIDYAMSVIVSRALPDVRDGLKPVHRRILYTMLEDGLRHDAKFRKSASVIGSALARYHPHGDIAVYDALVRMAQDFSLRYPLIQGQGNFGCFTKDTKVYLTDGRSLSFGELVEEHNAGKRNWTFSFNHTDRRIEVTEIRNPRLTRRNAELVEVELDNGQKIKCTPDHRFMLRKGSYCEAKDLQPGSSLMPLWRRHYEVASWRHKNDAKYVEKLVEGRQKYYSKKENIEFHRRLLAERNRIMWQNPKYRKMWIDAKKAMWRDPEYKEFMRKASSSNLKRLWQRKDFQTLLSRMKSEEMKKRWQDASYRATMAERMRQLSLRVWSIPAHRKYISELMIGKFKSLDARKRASEITKALWLNPEYRAKYSPDHFSKMAKKLWENPKMKQFYHEKMLRQRENPEFVSKNKVGLRKLYIRRIRKNPRYMRELTEKARVALRSNWKDPQYKRRVVKSKVLGYVYSLSNKYSKITPEIYKKERYNNCIPKIENALEYFDSFSEILEKARKYNHKVVRVKILQEKQDVYDLTVEPWHNFALAAGIFVHNSIDGDSAAAYRYTECRLSKIGEEMLRDIEKETVNWADNYDGTRKEPTVLPSPLPQLLLNGSLGIAVGMATNIPPHNLSEVCDALLYLIDHPKADTEELFKFIKGPDFPTGGTIFDQKEIIQAYSQGKGPILTRGKAEILDSDKIKNQIIISEIPFQVQKSGLIEQLALLVSEKKIEGIKDIRDESDKEGMRIVIELARDAYPQKILNRLYKFTDLQRTFHLNMLALVEGIQPRILNLPELLTYFIEHRKEVVFRRTKYDLQKAKEGAHILEGLAKALSKIDAVISTIKKSKDREDAKNNLIKKFKLTEIQASAILEIRLQQLARLERQKIEQELKEILAKIKELSAILKSPEKIKQVVKREISSQKESFGDERRTKVHIQKIGEIAEEDLVPLEETIITLTQGGYIKRINPKTYKIQKRGGKGILGMKTMQEDIVEHFLLAKTHDSLFFFTDSGKVFKSPVYEIPEGQRVARGRGLLNFLEVSAQDKVLSLFPLGKEDADLGVRYLVMATKQGIIKKTALADFENVRRSGLIAITLKKGDELKKVAKSTGQDEIILVTKKGQAIRFNEKQIREMGRPAAGIRGIRLKRGDEIIGMEIVQNPKSKIQNYLLVVMENGYGKRTEIGEYRLQGRGGSGIKTAKITSKTGEIVASRLLAGEEEDLIVISRKGQVIRTEINSIPKLSRATQGVRIMRLETGDKVASTACI